jgi:hypothetical protein
MIFIILLRMPLDTKSQSNLSLNTNYQLFKNTYFYEHSKKTTMIDHTFGFYWKQFPRKEDLLARNRQSPQLFSLALEDALKVDPKKAWRALWFINQLDKKEIEKHILSEYPQLIVRLEEEGSSLQRELLRLLQKFTIPEKWESYLFDQAQRIWEKLANIPSTRVQALYCMLKIADKYPELKQEIMIYNDPSFLEELSPGIKHQVQKIFAKL